VHSTLGPRPGQGVHSGVPVSSSRVYGGDGGPASHHSHLRAGEGGGQCVRMREKEGWWGRMEEVGGEGEEMEEVGGEGEEMEEVGGKGEGMEE